MKASDYLVQFFVNNGIDKVFGYIGGAVAHIYHSIAKNPYIEIINGICEQGSAFAAEGYARISGKSGVVIATSGPGATNLITSIGSCFFDSVPLLCITGQVNTYEFKYNKGCRQVGFQETDIVSIVQPIVKYAVMVDKVENLRYELEKAYFLANFKRKGPVLVDIPMNIQRAEFDFNKANSFWDSQEYMKLQQANVGSKLFLEEIDCEFGRAISPIVLIGGGVRSARARELVKLFLGKYQLPVVHSLMAKDVIESGYELNLGLIGSYGNRGANLALANSDLILVLGSRLDTRQTGTDLKQFAANAKIIQVDIDENELGAKIEVDIKILSDIEVFLEKLISLNLKLSCKKWRDWLLGTKNKFPPNQDINNNIKVENSLIEAISDWRYAKNVCVDVGQHQMWVAQSFKIFENVKVLFSGGMGAMGFALPCAIGAICANGENTIAIVGDGGFQMNIQELEVIKRRNLPVKIFVLNNQNLGMVRQFQEIYFEKEYLGTIKDYSVPDFKKIAEAYGIKSREIKKIDNFSSVLEEIFSSSEPELINIILENQFTSVEPKLIVGRPIEDMYPFIEVEELKKLMFNRGGK